MATPDPIVETLEQLRAQNSRLEERLAKVEQENDRLRADLDTATAPDDDQPPATTGGLLGWLFS